MMTILWLMLYSECDIYFNQFHLSSHLSLVYKAFLDNLQTTWMKAWHYNIRTNFYCLHYVRRKMEIFFCKTCSYCDYSLDHHTMREKTKFYRKKTDNFQSCLRGGRCDVVKKVSRQKEGRLEGFYEYTFFSFHDSCHTEIEIVAKLKTGFFLAACLPIEKMD